MTDTNTPRRPQEWITIALEGFFADQGRDMRAAVKGALVVQMTLACVGIQGEADVAPFTRLLGEVMTEREDDGYDEDRARVAALLNARDDLKEERAEKITPGLIADMYAALVAAERAIDDCQNYRSHLHHKELEQVRAALAKAKAVTP